MGLTTDPADRRLTHGSDPLGSEAGLAEVYLVLSPDELAKGYVRPLRAQYWHTVCGKVTTMHESIAATYASNPRFYGATYCAHCRCHRPVGDDGEFHWVDPTHPERQSPSDPKVGT